MHVTTQTGVGLKKNLIELGGRTHDKESRSLQTELSWAGIPLIIVPLCVAYVITSIMFINTPLMMCDIAVKRFTMFDSSMTLLRYEPFHYSQWPDQWSNLAKFENTPNSFISGNIHYQLPLLPHAST
ncbi:hypothetical protein CEXT_232791 [Caerostris extrusa]|uniref:Uncharacterized protein n=1 Tax=Caerostris extrusa TaxID=172846 RepID=A0AAV4XCH8_CAEEX|nr:hypothetical protein CEXT_232791 [Caerostris extrusa]